MLQEQFIASVGTPTRPLDANTAKDAAVTIHEFQPLVAQRAVFKKSATPPKCLAVSRDHIFAAQAGKAVLHVYNRAKGNQEATVPFTERITSIALACDDSVLVLGTADGRIFLWETSTGRQITTPKTHLQAVTAVSVDLSSNHLLSASNDSTVQVWSIPDLLSFTNSGSHTFSPLRTFNSHRSEVTALGVGHSRSLANIAVSAAKDRTCLIWDYTRNIVLRTFLLTGVPTCIALDPADRAAYLGYEDGDIQMLDLLVASDGKPDAVQNGHDGTVAIQPPPRSRWKLPDGSHGSALSIDVSYDGTVVLSGHESGHVLDWDVARASFGAVQSVNPLPGPVTGLTFLPVTGFRTSTYAETHIRIPEVTKPKFAAFDNSGDGSVPGNYALNVQFTDRVNASAHWSTTNTFHHALTASTLPSDLLDEGFHELATWGKGNQMVQNDGTGETSADFMALDDGPEPARESSLQDENARLKQQLEALRHVQTVNFARMEKMSRERSALLGGQRTQSRENGREINGRSSGSESD